ncbi:MAG: PD40 domain-containing protein [Candidatus Riflebacteria bacterium]|nr:PD40 domain-containing protein [Candidatus Riflebacteria bacterium]
MYCFRCGQMLVNNSANCPSCDTPQKRKQRRRQRLFLGLFIFLSGALVGSFVDSIFFQGKTWDYSIFASLSRDSDKPMCASETVAEAHLYSEKSDAAVLSAKIRAEEKMLARQKFVSIPASMSNDVTDLRKKTSKEPESLKIDVKTLSKSELGTETAEILKTQISSQTATATELPGIVDSSSNTVVITEQKPPEKPSSKFPDDDRPFVYDSVVSLEDSKGVNYHGSYSPDSQLLVFSASRPEIEKEKYQVHIKETGKKVSSTRLFPWPGNVWTPEFSRDGKHLVFSSDSQSPEHIFIYEKDTQKSRQLTAGKGKNMMPAISPDGKFIAFVSSSKGNNDIWLIGVDGSGLSQITSSSHDDREPRWFPDGKALIFTRIFDKYKDSRIMKIDLNPAGEAVELAGGKGRKWLADVSPDGKHLAYVVSENPDGSENKIVVRNISNGKEIVVAPFKGAEHFRPIWSPKNDGFVFHIDKKGKKDLFFAKLKRSDKK